MAMIGRKPYNPDAYVPSYQGTPSPVTLDSTPLAPTTDLSKLAPVPTIQPHPSFFGQGGVGRAIAGNIGDFLLQLGHMQPIYGPLTARRQDEQTAFERGEQTYQAHHRQALEDQMQLLAWKEAHQDPYRWRGNDGSLLQLDPTGEVKTLYKDPTPKMQAQWVANPDGTRTLIQVPVGGAQPQPLTDDDIARMEGGQSPQGSGGFRRP